ncbi:TRAP transporter substrate-binding protein [Roseibium sediminis]|uniref:TRAP transporter substrate-binding protein n=1 Tax=Roseibium sediminis TaxID=1775174 RepID=UPI00123CCBF0|nr:TRAP transporter substrate-binding protein [Roseibium sediminis]
MIKTFLNASVGALIAASAFIGGAASAETTLTLSSWLPPSHPIVANMIVPWTEEVEKATGGNVKVKILPKPLGKPPAHFDIAKDGLADVSYGVHGYQPGRFVMTKAVEMPLLGDNATATSVAYWRIHEKHLAQFDEHKGVKLLGLFTHGPGHIFNSVRPIEKLADLDGLKIRVGGGVVNDVAKSIGATALLKPAPESYELMSAGVADGVFFPQESIKSFKLTGLVKHGTLVPGGLYNTSFFLVMNPASFDKLSAEDQAAIMSVSGEHFAKIAGKGWDDADAAGNAAMTESGIALITASDDLVAEIKDKTAAVEAAWVDAVKEQGLDGAAVMVDLRAEIAKASSN